MQLGDLEGWYQLKQFGVFFLGVAVGSFCTIILFFYYGCFKPTTSVRTSTKNPSDESVESQNPPPSYSSLRFDKPKPCKLIAGIHCKNICRK